jgi:phosphatidylserine decarboxylase
MERLFVALQYILPQHLVSRLVGWLTRIRWAPFKRAFIAAFSRHYRIDLSEASESNPEAYATFNEFFTRSLREGARPMPADPDEMACPVDGVVSQAGPVRAGTLLQAKGHHYDLDALLGGGTTDLKAGAVFATLYLAPSNYHRIHMPVAGRLVSMRYEPGRLFSVNETTARHVSGLFSGNERVACIFETAQGPLAMVLVGALNVGNIETVWAGQVAPDRWRGTHVTDYPGEGESVVFLERGEEMGRFNMGSTVIVIAPDSWSLSPSIAPGRPVRVGQTLAQPSGRAGQDGRAAKSQASPRTADT